MKRINKHIRGETGKCINCGDSFIYCRPTQKYCGTRCQMKYEYSHGTRDPKKITEAAHKKNKEKGLKRFNESPNMRIGKRGYMLIYIPQKGWKKYHHWIWEQHHKQEFPKDKVLHHINCNKFDNRIENFQIMTNSEHTTLHHKLNSFPQTSKAQ